MYTQTIGLALGSGLTGITSDLRAILVDTVGADVGSAVAVGFVEIGGGAYLWNYESFPDAHRGGAKFYLQSTGAVLAFVAINPEEAEYTDVKTSTRNSVVPPTVGAIRAEIDSNSTKLDATISSRMAASSYTAPDNASITAIKGKTDLIPAQPAATGDIPTLSAIADGVLDELLSGHVIAGSVAVAISAAGSAADPLLNEVPGAYVEGSAGYALGTVMDMPISAVGADVISQLGSTPVTVVSPGPTSNQTINVNQGDSYELTAGSRPPFVWTEGSPVWPYVAGSTVTFVCSFFSKAGAIIDPNASPKQARVELTEAETALLVRSDWYSVLLIAPNGNVYSIVKRGLMNVTIRG